MKDPIERQAAIDEVRKCPVVEVTPAYMLIDKAEVMTSLMLLPSAQPEQRWIPCSERLPEVYEAGNSVSGMFMQSRPVLVYGVPEYESEHGFHVVTYCDDLNGITYWSTELDAVTINEVIAWMPLPEPYIERREE